MISYDAFLFSNKFFLEIFPLYKWNVTAVTKSCRININWRNTIKILKHVVPKKGSNVNYVVSY